MVQRYQRVDPQYVSEISIWGIIYIYTRTRTKPETQSCTYGGVVHLIWYVGFGVFWGRTNDSTYFMYVCWLVSFVRSFLFFVPDLLEKERNNPPPLFPPSPTFTHNLLTAMRTCAP